MLQHYLLTALRNLRRFQANTLINVFGLSLGLACFVAAIGVHTYIRSADRQLPNADRVVMVLQRFTDNSAGVHAPLSAQTSPALALSLRKEFPGLKVAFAWPSPEQMVVGDRRKTVRAIFADPEYLDVVDLPRTQSTPGNPLLVPRSAVLSEDSARRLFGTVDVLGRTIRLRDALDVTVAAVLKPIPQPSHMTGRYAAFSQDGVIVSRETREALQQAVTGKPTPTLSLAEQWFLTFNSATYVLLPEDGSVTASELESRLQGIAERNGVLDGIKNEFKVVPMSAALLASLDLNLFGGSTDLGITALLMVLAFAVLGVACANYANLAFAQATLQAKEIGLRKTVGASQAQVVHQAMVEAALQAIAAVAVALVLVFVVGSAIEARAEIGVLDAVVASGGFWLTTVVTALLVTGLIALYPSFALSRIRPALALRANSKEAATNAGAHTLLAIQFTATSALLVVLLVVFAQNSAIQSRALRSSGDAVIWLGNTYANGGVGFDIWKNELLRSPAIKVVSSTSSPPWVPSYSGLLSLQTEQGAFFNPNRTDVTYDFERALDLKLIAGRSFGRSFGDAERFAAGQGRVIVDETLVRRLGIDPEEAIGRTIRQGGRFESAAPVTVVGVIADKPLRVHPFLNFVGTVYVPGNGGGYPLVRIDKSRIAEGLKAIDETWQKLNPTEPIDRTFADESFARTYAVYRIIGTVLTVIASIALVVALLGAFGFATFVANRRSHEIGVRKTLGASAARIVTMLLQDFSKPVLIANVLGWPLAYVAAQKYLSAFEQRIDLTIWPFVFGVAFTLAVAWLAVGGQAWRAARVIPAHALRHE